MKAFSQSIIFTVLSLVASLGFAEAEFELKVGQWQPDYSGNIGLEANTVTFGDLGYGDYDHDVITAILRHPVPLLPNVRFQRVEMESDGVGDISIDFTFDGNVYTGGADTVTSSMDLSFTDVTLFYSPLSNWVTLDLGLTGRNFDGFVTATGSVNTDVARSEFEGWLPMLFGAARFELPLTGFYVDFTGNAISYDGDSVTDYSAAVGYASSKLGVNIVAELGSRVLNIEADDLDDVTDENLDLKISGVYFNLGLLF